MSTSTSSGELTYADIFEYLHKHNFFSKVVKLLKPNIRDLFNLARSCKLTWGILACNADLWREVYLDNDPLITAEIRKRLLRDKYTSHPPLLPVKRTQLQQSVWLRTCTLLYRKPNLLLVLAGKDPVVVRKLGSPESSTQYITLGLNYHLDSCLDEDEKRFAFEFPQVFQDLNVGDLVVTQDYKGAGCWTALPHPEDSVFLKLKKNGYDSAGLGILHKDVAPPVFPLFYYCDANLEDKMEKQALLSRQVYWFSYSQLKDKSMFSWNDHVVFDEL